VADGSELAATWTDIDFYNGVDGWTVDDNNRPCLRIPAKCRMVLPYTAFNLLSGDNQTFEIAYKAANCADYDDNIITISPNPNAAGFKGIRIKPTNITIHNASNADASADLLQGTNLCDEEVVHFVLTVNPYYSGNNKLVKAYINGCKNFLFEYTDSTEWSGFNGNLVIGSDYTDVFVYLIRHYPVALSDAAVQTNYINSLTSVSERDAMNYRQASVLDPGATNIDYETVKNNDYNFFVIQMTQGDGVPSAANNWSKDTKGKSILEMHFGKHPEWDWKIENPETMGQGTTSMNYYRWNIRWRIDKSNSGTENEKKVPVSYCTRSRVGSSYVYTWGDAAWSKTVKFDGNNHPPVMRITAKINAASSMQSHKIGATRAYTALHDAIGLVNEAQAAAISGGTAKPVVAVYEYPAFGFEYDPQSQTYTYIGLFTIGPDKGDKPTFGYDTVKSKLISMEGTDHSQPLAKFAYPWNADVNYFYNKEALAVDLGGGTYLAGLEVGNCHGKDTDKASGQDDCRAILNTEFKPVYELVWQNSTLIFPIKSDHPYYDTDAAHTLANINSHLTGETYAENFRLGQYNPRLGYADMQFWIEGDATYTLYYYDEKDRIYKPDISLLSQNGTPTGADPDAQNEWFKAQRRARFMAGAGDHWDLDDTIFHYVFCLMFGATDNFAKNSYPYKMELLANGGRWKWRQDDLDTIFDIDNSGRDSKPYMIEYEDAVGNTAYFAGSNSVFWTLIHECYWDDYNGGLSKGIRSIGRDVVNKMMDLSFANNKYDGIVAFISQCFWDNAQAYFPESAYNVDCEFKYEQAWLNNGQSVPPLSQALGNHFAGERLWVQRRAVYILSLFRTGPFGDYSDVRLGTISFRPTAIEVTLTPMMWLYPALCIGQNNIVNAPRTQAGVGRTISASVDPSGNTAAYIQASNYYTTLGNLKALNLGQQDIGNITITAAKLVQLLIGSETAGEVTTNIPGVILAANLKCLETIDFRNASSIRNLNGLAYCLRLRTLLLAGTNINSVEIQSGSKIETLSFPSSIQSIILKSLKHLTTFSAESLTRVITLVIEDSDIDVFGTLQNAYENSEVLKYIRVIWRGAAVDSTGITKTMFPALASGDYNGLAADGSTVLPKPYIEGILDGSAFGLTDRNIASLELDVEHATVVSGTIKSAQSLLFNTPLFYWYDSARIYISFADPVMEALCVGWWSSDGVGLTTAEAAAVTSVGGKWQNNTDISTFDEFRYFTGLTNWSSAFRDSSLTKLTLPDGMIIRNDAARHGLTQGCASLVEFDLADCTRDTSTTNNANAQTQWFTGCSSLVKVHFRTVEQAFAFINQNPNGMASDSPFVASTETHYVYINGVEWRDVVVPSTRTYVPAYACYRYNRILSVTTPSSITTIRRYAFAYCSSLASVTFNEGLEVIEQNAFQGCTALTSISFPSTLTTIGSTAFYQCTGLVGTLTIPEGVTCGDSSLSNLINITNLEVYESTNARPYRVSGTHTGNNTGYAHFHKDFTHEYGNASLSFKKIIIGGNYSKSVAASTFSVETTQVRIGGNVSITTTNTTYDSIVGIPNNKLAFCEIMGTITQTTNGGLFQTAIDCANGLILHLGYDAYTNNALPCTPTVASAGSSRVAKIYVGKGRSATEDNNILSVYANDANWGQYVTSGKVKTWYEYVNSPDANPEYVSYTPPTE
jgi:hypothetical protein